MGNIVTFKKFTHNGYDYLGMDNDQLNLIFLPSLGGKMVQLNSKRTGTKFFHKPQKPYKKAHYGDSFEKYDTSGFDECFPTIEKTILSLYHDKTEEILLPDHGELWSRPWIYDINGNCLKLSISGVELDYEFTKIITLVDNKIHISYKVKNNCTFGFGYIWSAHPLLNVEPGNKIYLADDIEEVFLNGSSNDTIGSFGDILPWPYLDKKNDFSIVRDKSFNSAVKVFTNRLEKGCTAIYKPDTNETLVYGFKTDEIPFLGMWLCYGGWPDYTDHKHLTIGLEPTNGRPDSLEKAISRNECPYLESGTTDTWSITLSVMEGKPDFQNCSNYIF
jgi:hypothetical protein